MRRISSRSQKRSGWIGALLGAFLPVPTLGVTPGMDIAEPRVSLVSITSGFVFIPTQSTVEQGDYVQWKNSGGGSHTSSSGNPCVASGLWNISLGAGVQGDRRFNDPPGNLPYFCIPHCGLGMTGTVRVTTRIALQTTDNTGSLHLTWSGGGPTYKVFRSADPRFAGATPMAPVGGDTGISFDDASSLSVGQINYYLVMNK